MEDRTNNKQRKKLLRAEAVSELKVMTRRLRSMNKNEDPIEVQKVIKNQLEKCNELYPFVKRKLDSTCVDSRHLREVVNLGQEVSKRITASSRPFELKRILIRLKREVNGEGGKEYNNSITRYLAEAHVNTCLLRSPKFEFFYGALKNEDLIVIEKKRRVREKLETKAVVTRATEKDVEIDVEQDSTPKEVEYINKQIGRLTKDKGGRIPFYNSLVDPKSFTQTVENIFHISFLVKEGKVGVVPDGDKKAVLVVDEASKQSQEVGHKANILNKKHRESILSFSMKDYKEWVSEFNIKERAFIPRNDSQNNDTR